MSRADTLNSASFTIQGNLGSLIAGSSASLTFKSVSEGPGSPIGRPSGNTLVARPGLIEILSPVCASNPSVVSRVGDPCDLDDDGDGVPDEALGLTAADNCSFVVNPGQENLDGDDLGDACDADKDGDMIVNISDNCPATANVSQDDFDGDAEGDACDLDDDNDGLDDLIELDGSDGFTTDPFNPDSDSDGILDGVEDRNADGMVGQDGDPGGAESDPNSDDSDGDGLKDGQEDMNRNGVMDSGETSAVSEDTDSDQVNDGIDNCPLTSNTSQLDLDGDFMGDVCDSDADSDGVLSGLDIDDLNPRTCLDSDVDQCDDCSIGSDGLGPNPDFFPANDGLDTDADGACNVGDTDDDGDGVVDSLDNCPLDANTNQLDSDNDGVGDACKAPVLADESLCFPVKSNNGSVVVICL